MFTINEIFDIILMTVVVGYVFKDYFHFEHFNIRNPLKFACLVTAPALILHELGHKFTALAYGLHAEFHAAYFWLIFAIIMKLIRFNFIFFVPAYVSITGPTILPLASMTIAFAGPAMNLLLYVIATAILATQKTLKKKTFLVLQITKQINLLLFVFNMIPIPGFDGYKVFSGLFQTLF